MDLDVKLHPFLRFPISKGNGGADCTTYVKGMQEI